jgi:hypothetical protein
VVAASEPYAAYPEAQVIEVKNAPFNVHEAILVLATAVVVPVVPTYTDALAQLVHAPLVPLAYPVAHVYEVAVNEQTFVDATLVGHA